MRRKFFRQISLILIVALLATIVGIAEDSDIELGATSQVNDETFDIAGFWDESLDETIFGDELLQLSSIEQELIQDFDGTEEADDDTAEPDDSTEQEEDTVEPADITENAVMKKYGVPVSATLGLKETFALKCTEKNLTYRTSSAKIAKVSKKGVIAAVKKGKATITVYSGKKKLTTCKVTVVAAPDSITLSGKNRKLTVGSSIMLMPILPKNTASKITWTSSKKSVASVDANGVVRALKKGTVKITARTFNGKKAVCKITVGEGASYLAFDTEAVSIGVKEKVTLKPQVNEGAKVKYTWSTGNKKIATVSKKGVVTGVKAGSTDVTVKTQNGLIATVKVTVLAAPKKVTLDRKKAEIAAGYTLQLKATLPKKTASQIKWITSDKKIASVDETGLVTAVSPGEATITAKTFNGKKAKCVVKVKESTIADQMEDVLQTAEDYMNADFDLTKLRMELLSPDDFDDSEEMVEFVEEYNAMADELNAAADDYSELMDELADSVIELDKVMGKTSIKVDDSGFSIDSEYLPVSVTNANARSNSNELTTGRMVINGNEVQLRANGIEELWESPEMVCDFVKNGLDWIDRVSFVVGNVEHICLKANKLIDDAIKTAYKKFNRLNQRKTNWEYTILHSKDDQKIADAKRALEQQKPHWDIAKMAYDSLNVVGKFTKWLVKAVQKIISAHVAAAIELGEDLVKITETIQIQTHGHPVQGRESEDAVRLEHAQHMNEAKRNAYIAIGVNAVWNVCTIIADLMVFSPAGFSKAVYNKFFKKETAKRLMKMAKNLRASISGKNNRWKRIIMVVLETGIDTISGASVEQHYNDMVDEHDILHGNIRGTISGKVIDADTKEPIIGALVENDEKNTYTNADGTFVLSAMYGMYAGQFALKCTKEGYEIAYGEVKVDEDMSDAVVTIELSLEGVPIDEAHFPDAVFRAYVRDHFDWNNNGMLSNSEARGQSNIRVWNMSISSLKGIEYFTELKHLYCPDNQLTELDVSSLKSLESLSCANNQLKGTMDLSNCKALKQLDCAYNQLSTLIVGTLLLNSVWCNDNQLTGTLDLGGNTMLSYVQCERNQLTSINLAGCSALKRLDCYRNSLIDLNLNDCTSLMGLHCQHNSFSLLDVSACPYLVSLLGAEVTKFDNTLVDEYEPATWTGDHFLFVDRSVTLIPTPTAHIFELGSWYADP